MFKKLEEILSMLSEYMENTHTHTPLNQTAEDKKDKQMKNELDGIKRIFYVEKKETETLKS